MITTISLHDQITTILRIRRHCSILDRPTSTELARLLDRPTSQVATALDTLYDLGIVTRHRDGTTTLYQIAETATTAAGTCACCDQPTHTTRKLFCETCAPIFAAIAAEN